MPEAKLRVPPVPPWFVLSASPPPPFTVRFEFTMIEWKALSVSVVPAVAVPPPQISGAATVISPTCAPALLAPPVVTVTFAVSNAVCRVVALMIELLPVAAKPEPVATSFEIVTLYGSSRRVPNVPFGAESSVEPV